MCVVYVSRAQKTSVQASNEHRFWLGLIHYDLLCSCIQFVDICVVICGLGVIKIHVCVGFAHNVLIT